MTIQALTKKAIKEKKLIEFTYEGHRRVVKSHLLGILGEELQLHAFQIEGSSKSDRYGWKNFKLANMTRLKLLPTSFHTENTFHPENANYTDIFLKI